MSTRDEILGKRLKWSQFSARAGRPIAVIIGMDWDLGGKDGPEWYRNEEALDFYTHRKFDDFLEDHTDPKLSLFAAFCSEQLCLENLDFVLAVRDYEGTYGRYLSFMPP